MLTLEAPDTQWSAGCNAVCGDGMPRDGEVRLTLEDVPAADSGEEDDRLGCDDGLIHVFLLVSRKCGCRIVVGRDSPPA
jgi:hypothetical protein